MTARLVSFDPPTLRNTSAIPTPIIHEVLTFVRARLRGDLLDTHVEVRDGEGSGTAYRRVPSGWEGVPANTRELIVCSVPPTTEFPLEWRYAGVGFRTGPPPFMIADQVEFLVYCLAHEASHVEQFSNGRGQSEVRCERFGFRVLYEWRHR